MAREKKRKGVKKVITPGWMVTYGDMTTLLLTFFVLMFTVAEIDGQELKLILSSFTGSFGIQTGGLTLQEGPLAEMGQQIETLPSSTAGDTLAELQEKAVSLKQDIEQEDQVEIVIEERGLKIMLLGDTFFHPGSARLTNQGIRKVERIGEFIRELKGQGVEYDYEVLVEGHTDNTPVSQKYVQYDNNIELSSARATAVVEHWIYTQGLNPKRTTIGGETDNKFRWTGLGEYKPIASNDTPEDRARNRRVEIIIKNKNTIRNE